MLCVFQSSIELGSVLLSLTSLAPCTLTPSEIRNNMRSLIFFLFHYSSRAYKIIFYFKWEWVITTADTQPKTKTRNTPLNPHETISGRRNNRASTWIRRVDWNTSLRICSEINSIDNWIPFLRKRWLRAVCAHFRFTSRTAFFLLLSTQTNNRSQRGVFKTKKNTYFCDRSLGPSLPSPLHTCSHTQYYLFNYQPTKIETKTNVKKKNRKYLNANF